MSDILATNQSGSSITFTGETNITLLPNAKTIAFGLASFAGGRITANEHVSVSVNNESYNGFYGLRTGREKKNSYSYITIKNGLTIKLPANTFPGTDNTYAAFADKYGIIDIKDGNSTSNINGTLAAWGDGAIFVDLSKSTSTITGYSETFSNGRLDVTLSNSAKWNLVSMQNSYNKGFWGDSNATQLILNGGVLDMTASTNVKGWEDDSGDHAQILTLRPSKHSYYKTDAALAGTGGTILMDMDLVQETRQEKEGTTLHNRFDQIDVQGSASGVHNVVINFTTDLAKVDPQKVHSENWLIHQKTGELQLNGSSSVNGGLQTWSLKFFKSEDELPKSMNEVAQTTNKSDGGEGWWYLVRNDESDLPPEPNENINVGTSTGQALAWAAELEDLRLRLGEVRYGAQDGAWVKASFTKDRAHGSGRHGFEQETNALHLGFDRLVGTSEASSWLLGGSFRYGHSEQDGFAEANGGSGELDQYSVKAYATWMHESGTYLDFVAQTGWYEQSLEGTANDGKTRYTASYNTWGSGASIEIGRMFTLHQDPSADDRLWWSHWFVEPQAQLSYFKVRGEDYTTSSGLKVSQGDADFLTGRLGAVLGKKVSYGCLDDLEKRFFQAALMGGLKYEFKGDQGINFTGSDNVKLHVDAADMGGIRWYYGFMLDWQITDDLRLYGQVSREEGSHYTREYDVHFGAKYQF